MSQLLPMAQHEGPLDGDIMQYSEFGQQIPVAFISRPLTQH